MSPEKIIEKVRKMLKLAENNPFPEEAQNAMLLAQQFMATHNITINDIEVEQPQQKEVNDRAVGDFESRLEWWKKQLCVIVGENFRCHPYISKRYRNSRVCFIGIKDDIEIAKEVYLFAANAINHYSKVYASKFKERGTNTTGIKNDYIQGFLKGLSDKFKEQVVSYELSLVLVKDDAVIKFVEEKRLKKGARSHVKSQGNNEAKESGYRQGKSFNYNSKLINC